MFIRSSCKVTLDATLRQFFAFTFDVDEAFDAAAAARRAFAYMVETPEYAFLAPGVAPPVIDALRLARGDAHLSRKSVDYGYVRMLVLRSDEFGGCVAGEALAERVADAIDEPTVLCVMAATRRAYDDQAFMAHAPITSLDTWHARLGHAGAGSVPPVAAAHVIVVPVAVLDGVTRSYTLLCAPPCSTHVDARLSVFLSFAHTLRVDVPVESDERDVLTQWRAPQLMFGVHAWLCALARIHCEWACARRAVTQRVVTADAVRRRLLAAAVYAGAPECEASGNTAYDTLRWRSARGLLSERGAAWLLAHVQAAMLRAHATRDAERGSRAMEWLVRTLHVVVSTVATHEQWAACAADVECMVRALLPPAHVDALLRVTHDTSDVHTEACRFYAQSSECPLFWLPLFGAYGVAESPRVAAMIKRNALVVHDGRAAFTAAHLADADYALAPTDAAYFADAHFYATQPVLAYMYARRVAAATRRILSAQFRGSAYVLDAVTKAVAAHYNHVPSARNGAFHCVKQGDGRVYVHPATRGFKFTDAERQRFTAYARSGTDWVRFCNLDETYATKMDGEREKYAVFSTHGNRRHWLDVTRVFRRADPVYRDDSVLRALAAHRARQRADVAETAAATTTSGRKRARVASGGSPVPEAHAAEPLDVFDRLLERRALPPCMTRLEMLVRGHTQPSDAVREVLGDDAFGFGGPHRTHATHYTRLDYATQLLSLDNDNGGIVCDIEDIVQHTRRVTSASLSVEKRREHVQDYAGAKKHAQKRIANSKYAGEIGCASCTLIGRGRSSRNSSDLLCPFAEYSARRFTRGQLYATLTQPSDTHTAAPVLHAFDEPSGGGAPRRLLTSSSITGLARSSSSFTRLDVATTTTNTTAMSSDGGATTSDETTTTQTSRNAGAVQSRESMAVETGGAVAVSVLGAEEPMDAVDVAQSNEAFAQRTRDAVRMHDEKAPAGEVLTALEFERLCDYLDGRSDLRDVNLRPQHGISARSACAAFMLMTRPRALRDTLDRTTLDVYAGARFDHPREFTYAALDFERRTSPQ